MAVTRIVSKPAAFASSILAIATAGSAFRPSSSAAPMYMWRLAAAPAGRTSAATAQVSTSSELSFGKKTTVPRGNGGGRQPFGLGRQPFSLETAPESVNPRTLTSEDPSDGGVGQALSPDNLTVVRIVLPSSRRR